MLKLDYSYKQKKHASTLLSLSLSELEASETLVGHELFREAIVHMYFCCFYASQALLIKHVPSKPSHKNLEAQMHKIYGKSKVFPRRYVDIHTKLHNLRNEFNYNVTHSPSPKLIEQKLRVLQAYVAFAFSRAPKLETTEILASIIAENESKIKDFSYDIYCPKTYAHHTRLTLWQPPFYLNIFSANNIQTQARRMLQNLHVKRPNDYVVGINSRLNQYAETHLIMLDIDSLDSSVEAHLSRIGGILLKSGRGFHFIGNTVIEGQDLWEKTMRQLKRSKELKPYLDHDHIDISLRRGYATLRVTTSKVKPHAPVFFKEL
ncbi:HEPN domain-containing protein [Burkholderia gladioli]|uniref:primase 1D-like protein n=1 Tax=Burkholderia gladioli TaxID=28095 RepID=UPI001CB4B806|nr:HEPN domain-containing protein [Burkholderia gladioli]CAG9233852.1 HEPN domain-containing protein [Burkholderia gladioli]